MMEALAALERSPEGAAAGVALLALFALLALLGLRRLLRAGAGPDTAAEIARLRDGQQQLTGAVAQLAEAQLAAQSRLGESLAARLERAEGRMGDSLAASAARTAHALGALGRRLAVIDRAQGRMEALSGDLIGLSQILSNKQTRGQFGEIQLMEIVSQTLAPDAWEAQATLSNGRRVDCLIRFATPPGPVPVDSKFPLEPYEALLAAEGEPARRRARAALRSACLGHIRAIAERYVLPGETADQALMFVPSEAVYAEIHDQLGDTVEKARRRKVYIVSPTTLWAVLNTLRAVIKDTRLQEQAQLIQVEVRKLLDDVGRLDDRVGKLASHFGQVSEDIRKIQISTEKIVKTGQRIDELELDQDEPAPRLERAAES